MEVKPGYKQTEVGVIPEEWDITRLDALVDQARSIRYGIVQPGKFDPQGRYMIRGQDYSKGWVDPSDLFRVGAAIEERYRNARVKVGDLIITIVGAGTGYVDAVPDWLDGANLTQTTARIAIDPSTAHSEFCKFILQSSVGKNQVAEYVKGAAQPGLNCGDIKKFLLPLPSSKDEQRAIATALSDVDALIGALDRLIAKKRDLKQAVMQQLLTGQKRLPGFHGEWEVRSLHEVCQKIQDGTHFSPKLGGNDYLYVTSKNIGFGKFDVSTADRIDAAEHAKIYARCDVKKGDLLLTKDGANTGNAALNPLDEPFSLLSSVALLRFDCRRHLPAYFLYQILSFDGQRQIKDLMSGNAITRLTLVKIRSLRFAVTSFEEQTAIAEVLSDMDAELAALEQSRDKTRALKQGMMQELLTGRTRLVDKPRSHE